MRCGDCKHWKRLDLYDDKTDSTAPSDFGQCERVVGKTFRDPEGTLNDTDLEYIGNRNAAPCDGSGYHAALITRSRFGCVDFEPTQQSGEDK